MYKVIYHTYQYGMVTDEIVFVPTVKDALRFLNLLVQGKHKTAPPICSYRTQIRKA